MKYKQPQSGFTITELSLAMSLLGVLMFILLISAMNFVNIYNKGITLKRVNQSGSNIGAELQANLRRSGEVVAQYTNVGAGQVATGVCTGNYSFIWSVYPSGAGTGGLGPTGSLDLKYDDGSQVYFAKVKDPKKEECPQHGLAPPSPPKAQSTELLGDSLVVRDPSTSFNQGGLRVLLSGDNKLATIIYTISTNGGDDIVSDGTDRASCQGGKEHDFCALNTFVVTTYSKGV